MRYLFYWDTIGTNWHHHSYYSITQNITPIWRKDSLSFQWKYYSHSTSSCSFTNWIEITNQTLPTYYLQTFVFPSVFVFLTSNFTAMLVWSQVDKAQSWRLLGQLQSNFLTTRYSMDTAKISSKFGKLSHPPHHHYHLRLFPQESNVQ